MTTVAMVQVVDTEGLDQPGIQEAVDTKIEAMLNLINNSERPTVRGITVTPILAKYSRPSESGGWHDYHYAEPGVLITILHSL